MIESEIISFHSIRSGSGKSTLVANLAGLLVSQGKDVVVVEADFRSPSMHLFFKLPGWRSTYSFDDYLRGACSMRQAVYEVTANLGFKTSGKLHLAPAAPLSDEAYQDLRQRYTFETLNDGFQAIIQTLHPRYILVDNVSGLHEEALLSAASSGQLVLVLQADPLEFQGAAAAVEVAQRLNVPEISLILNNAPTHLNVEKARQELGRVYGCKVIAILPHSPDLTALGSNGLLPFERPQAAILEHFQQLLENF